MARKSTNRRAILGLEEPLVTPFCTICEQQGAKAVEETHCYHQCHAARKTMGATLGTVATGCGCNDPYHQIFDRFALDARLFCRQPTQAASGDDQLGLDDEFAFYDVLTDSWVARRLIVTTHEDSTIQYTIGRLAPASASSSASSADAPTCRSSRDRPPQPFFGRPFSSPQTGGRIRTGVAVSLKLTETPWYTSTEFSLSRIHPRSPAFAQRS
jgi:hypothetical protein